MKLAFFSRFVPPAIDGIGDYTWHLASRLRDSGIDTRIYTSKDQPSPKSEGWIHPVIAEWRGKKFLEAISSIPFEPDSCSFQYVPHLYGRYGLCWETTELPLILRKKWDCRIHVTFHEIAIEAGADPVHFLLRKLMLWQARRLARASDSVVTTCTEYAETLRGLAQDREVKVIPVGANVLACETSDEELAKLRRHYRMGSAKVLAMFGRLTALRNYPAAIRLLGQAKKENLDARLMVIGIEEACNPSLFQELISLARDLKVENDLIFPGRLSRESVSRHLQLADLYLFPQFDGISTKNGSVMAALAHGLPLLSYAPFPGYWIEEPVPEIALAATGDEAGWIQAGIKRLRQEKDGSQKRRRNALYFEQNFSWPRIAAEFLDAMNVKKECVKGI